MQKKLFFLISVFSLCVAAYGQSNDRKNVATEYKIAFASFAPLNLDVFIANADGSNAKPLMPHPAQDYNASFSSNGKWIVFTSTRNGVADIYRVRPDGSALTRLTDHPAFDDQGALSPDGKWLAFVSSRSGQTDIWLLELATKKLRNLTQQQKPKGGGDFRPAWSPDGKWLAFSSDRDSTKPLGAGGFTTRQMTELYVMHADGANVRRVTQSGEFVGSPVWSADGKQLLFYEATIEEVGNIVTVLRKRGTSQIVSLNLATNERRTLTTGKGEKWSPQWLSPNRIAYCSGGPEGGLEFISTANGEKTAGLRGEFRNPHWSPDGKRMIFQRDTDSNWPPFQPFASRDAQFNLLRTGVYPSASPDGARLISNSEPGAFHHNKILIMNYDGTQRAPLLMSAEKSIVAPVWSPQGNKIAFGFGRFFQVFNGKVIGDIAVIDSDGTNLQILTDGTGNNGFPSWSPDGKKIVYRSSGGATEGLFILDVATRAVTPLLTGGYSGNFPAWSPLGDRIAFTSKRDGDYDIYTVKPDGTDLKRITTTPGNDAHCVWSPDGKWLAFSSERQGFKDESALYPYNAQPYGDLYVMRADGSDVRQLTDDQFEKATPGWIPKRKR